MQEMCASIYKQALADNFKPELLVCLSRGGLVPLGYLSGETMFNNRDTRIINLTSYEGDQQQASVTLLTPIRAEDYAGFGSLLVIDDLVDSGKSIEFVLQELKKVIPTDCVIKVATLFYKERSTIKPNYYDAVTDKWIVFPWDN